MQNKNDMKRYEEETGKNAIWNGIITKEFLKWKNGEVIYNRNKSRISLYLSPEEKAKWKKFVSGNDKLTGFSHLIRESVSKYMGELPENEISVLDASQISHDLKEPLTTIKAYSQLLIEKYGSKFPHDVINIIKSIHGSSLMLENKIRSSLDTIEEKKPCDILIIEDNYSTVQLLTRYFQDNGYCCKAVLSGREGIKELENIHPKLILLDILLPDMDGYKVCNIIKSNINHKNIKVYYMTGFPKSKFEKEMLKTKAEGYFQKPFDLSDFNILFDVLNN